jgi:signal transduction histidine kinase
MEVPTLLSDAVQNVRRTEGAAARALAVVTMLLALGVIALGTFIDPDALSRLDLSLAPWLVMVAGATLATISFGRGKPALSMDLPILLACSFCVGPIPAGVVAILGAWDRDELRGRIPVSRAVFNHAQTALATMAAGYVFQTLGVSIVEWPDVIPSAFAALVADAAVNVVAVASITALSEGVGVVDVIRATLRGKPEGFAVLYLAFGFMGLLIAATWVSAGAAGLILFALPVLLAREAFRQRERTESLALEIDSHREVLRRLDERIAEERRDERIRIAEALHHDVLQSLNVVSLQGDVIQQDFRTGRLLDLEQDVPGLVTACRKAAEELRDVIGGLQASPVGSAGLVRTLELFVSDLHAKFGLNFVCGFEPDMGIEPALELVIYRVAQEASLNAARHSQADTVWVDLSRKRDTVFLSVVDNGIGMAPFDRDKRRSFGLTLMRERVLSVGGELDIRSKRTLGTHIEARFPARLEWRR